MIALFSKSKFEGTTDDVMDWLIHFKANFQRINGSDYFKEVSFGGQNNTFSDRLNDVKSCWFRRWIDDDFFGNLLKHGQLSPDNRQIMEDHLRKEFNLLTNELWRKLKDCHWISKPSEIGIRKLEVLDKARQIGLRVPATLITSKKSDLIHFKSLHTRIITKTIGDVPHFRSDGYGHSMHTSEVEDDFIQQLDGEFFFPSLFQALIEKDFELRVFFLGEKFFPMAIFSQRDKQTQLDFRNYNKAKPNRTTPFKLPVDLQEKLIKLVNAFNLTTGSIDIVRQKNTDEYFFLEINPVGQIGMTSYPCNYYLEREIAKQLMSYEK
ncbi:MAG TPA: grasp-with-spasm system ATP-grasp peptide maturase [Chryseosolibacter sp.]